MNIRPDISKPRPAGQVAPKVSLTYVIEPEAKAKGLRIVQKDMGILKPNIPGFKK